MLPQRALVGFSMGLWYVPCERFATYSGFPIRPFYLGGGIFGCRRFFVDLHFITKGAVTLLSGFEKDHQPLPAYTSSTLLYWFCNLRPGFSSATSRHDQIKMRFELGLNWYSAGTHRRLRVLHAEGISPHTRLALESDWPLMIHSDAASVGSASMNESIDSLSRSLTPRTAPL